MSTPTSSAALLAAGQQWWQRTTPRERTLVLAASAGVGLALLWWLGIAPALRVWQQSTARQQQLDSQWQQLLGLQQQAQSLQARPALNYDSAVRALESAMPTLGSGANLSVVGERATVTLRNVPASALGPWLAQVRSNARALPAEAHLTRTQASNTPPPRAPASGPQPPAPPPATPVVAWDGTLVLALPPR